MKKLKILDRILDDRTDTIDSDVQEMFSSLDELKEFQSLYESFQNDKGKKLKKFLHGSTHFEAKLTLILENAFKKAMKDESLIMLALHFEDFPPKGSRAEVIMKKFRQLDDLMNEDLSAISLLGNDNYDSKKDLSDVIDALQINEIPMAFKKSLIQALFQSQGAMEWSIDGESRCLAIDTLMPLYNNAKVLDIYKEILTPKLEEKIASNVESVMNSITEMTVHPEKIFSLKEQKYMLSQLETIIKTFDIKINHQNVLHVEDFNHAEKALEMGMPMISKLTKEKIQSNVDQFKNHTASNVKLEKPKRKSKI